MKDKTVARPDAKDGIVAPDSQGFIRYLSRMNGILSRAERNVPDSHFLDTGMRRAGPCWIPTLAVCLIFVVLGVPIPARAASRESLAALFAQANASYQKGDFGTAEREYRQLVDKGVDSGALYYNLGNVCFKQKKLGEAIYFWEKAKQKLPGDPDVRENLELANLLVVDRIEVPPNPLPLRWLDSMVHGMTIARETWVVAALFILTNGLLSIYLLGRNSRMAFRALISTSVAGTFVLILCCSLAWKVYEQGYRRAGVVIEQKADVRSGPGMENITVFTVHEGILLRIRGENNGWYQVILPNGWSGWLQKSFVRVL